MDTSRYADGKSLHADEYRLSDHEPYEAFQAAIADGTYPNTVTGWEAFCDDRHALEAMWPEYTDDLDYLDSVWEIEV